jgi:anti-anti-sigma factor
MDRPFRQIEVERRGDVFCVRLRHRQLDENQVQELSRELLSLIQEDGCRKMVLSLGPGSPDCLYSVFLAKLFTVRRRLVEAGGGLKLCDVTDDVRRVFEACHLQDYFDFAPDLETAVARFS